MKRVQQEAAKWLLSCCYPRRETKTNGKTNKQNSNTKTRPKYKRERKQTTKKKINNNKMKLQLDSVTNLRAR